MLEPEFYPVLTVVQIGRSDYPSLLRPEPVSMAETTQIPESVGVKRSE